MVNRRSLLESDPAQEAYQYALTSANAIARVVEDLFAEDLLRRVQVHV